jgi:hypothetical protein
MIVLFFESKKRSFFNKILWVLVTISCISCSSKSDNTYLNREEIKIKTIFYKIKTPLRKNSIANEVYSSPLPPHLFYGEHNFILYNNSKIFYHNDYFYHYCGTGIDFSKPPKLYLTVDSLTEIPREELEQFLNKMPSQNSHVTTSISSNARFIKNDAFPIILQYVKANNFKILRIRNWTEEEANALLSKINATPYDPARANFNLGFDMDYTTQDVRFIEQK